MKKNKQGFTLLEVMIAIVIISVVFVSILNINYFMSTQSVKIKEQTFATQKAMQMMEELRSLVSGSEKESINILDDYGQGTSTSPILSIDRNIINPAAAPSNNIPSGTGWKFLRKIEILPFEGEPFTRRVYVRVYKTSPGNPNQPAETLAETFTVLKTIKSDYAPSQVMDVYVIGIENIPGWWSTLSTLRPIFSTVVQDIKNRCTGLNINTHLITRTAYGRNPEYVPYINSTDRADSVAMPYIYFYPGKIQKDDGSDLNYYDPDIFEGKINIDGQWTNFDRSFPYNLADMYNHAMRYPEEEELYNYYAAQAQIRGLTPPEISLRMLIEKMNSDSASFKNVLLLNLHGELLPLPPIRNYSDPAKDPESNPNVRVVAHPAKIQYYNNESVSLRVYSYVTNPDSWISTSTLSVITIFLPNRNLTTIPTVQKILGDDTTGYYKKNVTFDAANFTISYIADNGLGTPGTLITLYNSPLRHPACTAFGPFKGGLPSANRLYGMEYIPCPIHPNDTLKSYEWDLCDNNNNTPKNTARWMITFPVGSFNNGTIKLETRIGTDLTTGATPLYSGVKPQNLSKTYFWMQTYGLSANSPVTEQYQFIGDPRYCPYLDTKENDNYNWWFQAVPNADYKGFLKTTNGWGDDTLDIDVPRFFQMYRQALLKTQAIWSAMNGWSYYYYGLGGEFGSDIPPISSGIYIKEKPWNPAGTNSIYVDEILPYNHGSCTSIHSRVVAKTDNTWYAKYWLGELFPDNQYALWKSTGNLATGSGNFYRPKHTQFGTDLGNRTRTVRTASKGCQSFFNGGPFGHASATATGNLTTPLGLNLSSTFNFPLMASVDAPRPFTLNTGTGDLPPEWNDNTYNNIRTTLSIPLIGTVSRVYYDSSYNSATYDASAVIKMTLGTDTCYLAVTGIADQSEFGTAQISKMVLISMLRAFLDGGQYTGQDKISQIPYVHISSPVVNSFYSPTTLAISWVQDWKRWDGDKYTEEYADGYTETTPIVFALKYSENNGRTWKYCSDNTSTRAGNKDLAYTTTNTSFDWNVSALQRSSYIIRLECFRKDINLHYSYDQMQIYISR